MNVLWLLRRGNPSSAASLVPVVNTSLQQNVLRLLTSGQGSPVQHQQNMHRSKSRLTQLIDEMFQNSRPAMCAQHISESRVWGCIQFESNIFLSRDLKQAHISILTCMRVSTVPSRPSSPDLLLENYCSNKSISNQSRNSYLTSTLHCQLVAFTIVRWRIAAQFSNRTAGMLVGRLSGSKLFQSL